jgi:hypothetical protein
LHSGKPEVVEYFPAAQGVQAVAPSETPLLVIEPAEQFAQNITFDAVAYWPTKQAVQFVAAAATPVLVIEPIRQSLQYDCPSKPWYLPGGQVWHAVEPSIPT